MQCTCTCICNVYALEKCEFWLELGMRPGISVFGVISEEEEGEEEEEEEAGGKGGRIEEFTVESSLCIPGSEYVCCRW